MPNITLGICPTCRVPVTKSSPVVPKGVDSVLVVADLTLYPCGHHASSVRANWAAVPPSFSWAVPPPSFVGS